MTISARDATDPRHFAWVSANAGSGKTRLLTDRVTRLLLHGASVSRILCLTFTKAAAAEMASRLFERLGAWALLPDDKLRAQLVEIGASPAECARLNRARRLFAEALETPGGLKIQTIHAFCQHLLSRFPVEAGIPARFSVLDDRGSAELLDDARRFVLEKAAGGDAVLGPAIALLAARASDGKFADILNSAICDRGRLTALLARFDADPERFFRHLHKVLDVPPGETEADILGRLCAELAEEKSQFIRAAGVLARGKKGDTELCTRLGDFFESEAAPENFDRLIAAFFTQAGEVRRKLVTNSIAADYPGETAWLETVRERVVAAEDRKRRAMTAQMTMALLRTAFAVFDRYESTKRKRAALDYDDLITGTIRLLTAGDSAQWVLYKLDGGIDHILVDEGQDTSREQWQIVSKLSEEFFAGLGVRPESRPRRLFVVGDEKQSIFSFQGAEPAAFGQYREAFREKAEQASLPFADFRPSISRRSAQTILQFVDEVFASEAARDGLTSTGDAIQHDADRAVAGRVEIWPLVPAPEKRDFDPLAPVDVPVPGAHSILASRIAARIAGWLEDGVAAPDGGPISAGDIMILVRRRNAFTEEMIRELIAQGVPVAGADRMVLAQQIAVMDLVALGHFVLLPEDDLNLAALLKSPVHGWSEEELYALAHGRERSLWDELCARADERPAFAASHELLRRALAESGMVPPFEFYSRVLNRGARKRLIARLGLETEDAIDEFLALALTHEASHEPSLQGFLAWFAEGAGEVKRDMEQAGGAVRIMTVHGAKGLEAKIVILPDTFQVPGQEARDNILYSEDCAFYAMPSRAECEPVAAARQAARDSDMREYRRLLYVAATRARDVLIIAGYHTGNRKKPSEHCWYSLLEPAGRKLGQLEENAGQPVLAIGAPMAAGVPPGNPAPQSALPDFLNASAKPERIAPLLRPSRLIGEEPPVLSPVAGKPDRFERGLMIHGLLARLPEVPHESRAAAGVAWLRRQGVPEAEGKALADQACAIIAAPQVAHLFGPESRAEVAITARFPELGGAQISGQIDRLCVTAEAVLIADFKTNREVPVSVGETPRAYLAQMALYRAALHKIFPGKAVSCALIWTDSATLMALPDDVLDREMERIATTSAAISTAQAQLDPN